LVEALRDVNPRHHGSAAGHAEVASGGVQQQTPRLATRGRRLRHSRTRARYDTEPGAGEVFGRNGRPRWRPNHPMCGRGRGRGRELRGPSGGGTAAPSTLPCQQILGARRRRWTRLCAVPRVVTHLAATDCTLQPLFFSYLSLLSDEHTPEPTHAHSPRRRAMALPRVFSLV
jgi:hypothetical protein